MHRARGILSSWRVCRLPGSAVRAAGKDAKVLIAGVLFIVGAVAGFVDAIAGGGGLLTMPALFLTGIGNGDALIVLGTNKGQGVCGTATSLHRFWQSPLLDRRRAAMSFPAALAGAAGGVCLALRVPNRILAPLIIVLLAGVAVFMIVQRPPTVTEPPRQRGWLLTLVVAFAIAFYDGFFGPGTGTFVIFAYAYFWCDSLDAASANAKVVNFGSNLAAMVAFAALGKICWRLALPMAVGQIIGGYLGAHATIRSGRNLVRVAVVVVSIALIGRLLWGIARS